MDGKDPENYIGDLTDTAGVLPAHDVVPETSKVDAEVGKSDEYEPKADIKAAPKEPKVFPMRETVISLGNYGELRFNWFVSLFGLTFLWGLAIFCMASPDKAKETVSTTMILLFLLRIKFF